MSPLVESLKLKDGVIQHLGYHQSRLDRSMAELFPGAEAIDLSQSISIPEQCAIEIFKIRVVYGPVIEIIEIEPYQFRSIERLKVVHHPTIDYHLKYTDRQILDSLFAQRGDCDDIIIVKNGWVTDSYAANLLFFDGQRWVTPSTPLLKGTKRQWLLHQGIIIEKDIRVDELRNYQKVGLVNAIIDFDEMSLVAVEQVLLE